MAFFQDAVEEFKTLNPAGKVVVIGVLVGAAVIGYAIYRNRAVSGTTATSTAPDASSNPFTITTLTNPPKTAITTPQPPLHLPVIAHGIVNRTKDAVKKAVKPPSVPHPVQPIGPSHPIQTVTQHVTQALQRVNPQNRGVPSRSAPNTYSFWPGPTAQISNFRQPHPIEAHQPGSKTVAF